MTGGARGREREKGWDLTMVRLIWSELVLVLVLLVVRAVACMEG